MIYRIFRFWGWVVVLFVIGYFLHHFLFPAPQVLLKSYLFFAVASLMLYIVMERVIQKSPKQVGFTYFVAIFIKMALFVIIFNDFLSIKTLSKAETTAVFLPFLLFLIVEIIGVLRLLNKSRLNE